MDDLIRRQDAIDCEYQVKIINDIEYVMLSEVQMKMRKLPSAHLVNDSQGFSQGDYISRQDAIDAFDGVKVDEENSTDYDIGYNDGIDFAVSRLSVLPSAQPKTGEWIEDGYSHFKAVCDQCGEPCATYVMGKPRDRFCKWCGADMRGASK